MSDELLIENLCLTKQRINEGSKTVRDQIDFNVLPLCGDDQVLIKYVKGARKEFTDGDKAAKAEIDKAIHYVIQPTPPVDVLPEELAYWNTKEWIAPFFIPPIFYCTAIRREDLTWFANRMARRHHGNVIRGFPFGVHEPYWITRGWSKFPFQQNNAGKFMLTKYDESYWDELFFRIEEFTKRNITVFLDLIDNCSIHKRTVGWWAAHPWNGLNNVNGTSDWNNMLYHYYEDEHASKPGAKETGEFSQLFYRDLVTRTWSRFAGRIGYGAGNEVHARNIWHNIMANIVEECAPGITRDFMITSMSDDGFYSSNTVASRWILSVHGGCSASNKSYSEEGYKRRIKILPDRPNAQRSIMSQDGCFPIVTCPPTEDIVHKILKDGRAGFEQNLRPILIKVKENGKWKWKSIAGNPDRIDWSFRSINYAFAEAVKIGWLRYRNEES